ncbi:hypothetical protein [Burkholderia singularis]|uniref:hypothetical protein n=1 Tax=Burkholderia singularis TaxID=1503053 RepID=UPI00117D3665|nr:hypothetical protein [Burkholderia singularis]
MAACKADDLDAAYRAENHNHYRQENPHLNHSPGIKLNSLATGLLGGIIGSAITALVALYNSHRQRRTEMDARVLGAAFEFAAIEWRGHIDKSISTGNGSVPPPDTFLVRAIEIARLAHTGKNITATDIQRINERSDKLTAELFALQHGSGSRSKHG